MVRMDFHDSPSSGIFFDRVKTKFVGFFLGWGTDEMYYIVNYNVL